jgi:hypothetical protein
VQGQLNVVVECGQSIGAPTGSVQADKPHKRVAHCREPCSDTHYVRVPILGEHTVILRLLRIQGGQETKADQAHLPVNRPGKGKALQQDVKLIGPKAGLSMLSVTCQMIPLDRVGTGGLPSELLTWSHSDKSVPLDTASGRVALVLSYQR